MIRHSYLLIVLVLCALAPAIQTGEPFKPGKLPPAEVAALQQGLTLRFYAGDKPLDARRVRLAALHVPANEPPSPFVPGSFVAKFSGYIKNPLKGTFSFRMTGTGSIVLKINDKVLLNSTNKEAEVELAKNYNRIEIECVNPAMRDATMRLYWAGEKFGFEPVPPEVLFSRGDDAFLVEQTRLREGRLLYATLHCKSCHPIAATQAVLTSPMPEWQSAAPRLDEAGSRFNSDWLAAWIANPRALRPDATMPRVFSGPDTASKAADIAAYLMSVKQPSDEKPKAAVGAGGALLFEKLGCNSCHRLNDPSEKDELGRLSLHFLAAKFAPDALVGFLQAPHKYYAWSRMPDFRLTAKEAAELGAYLVDNAKGKIDGKTKGDATRGTKLFNEAGCIHCHDRPGKKGPEPRAIRKMLPSDKGCLADKVDGRAPDFGLSAEQRAALIVFFKTDGTSLTRDPPAEFAARQVKSLQCNSCHRRDGELTRWHAVLEEAGKIPEALPSLTWTGEKLKPAWAKRLFTGESNQSARPWIKARMPAFPARAELLAAGLSHEHGFGILDDDRPPHDAKLAAVGEKLIPQQGGFNCINCHGIGKTPPIAPFEAPGINLTDAAVRLRFEYYQRWMLAPDRVDVVMRMPVFAADGKTTQLREVYDGDARKQFGALWHYIQTLPGKKQ